jgi:hypothetical protein
MAGVDDEQPALDPEVQDEIPPQTDLEPQGEDQDDDEVVVSFGDDEEAPSSDEERDTDLARHLRAELRRRDKEILELRRSAPPSQAQTIEVGDKPTLEGCDFDADTFEAEYEAWQGRKTAKEQSEAQARKAQEDQQAAWNKELEAITAQKAKLGFKDYDRAAEEVKSTLSDLQQAIIVKAASTPAQAATLIYALGKNPQRLAAIATIQDPVKLIAELVRMEGKLTVSTRKAPEPERIARGSQPLSAGRDKELERLEKEADRHGDRTKVIAYKRTLREKAR